MYFPDFGRKSNFRFLAKTYIRVSAGKCIFGFWWKTLFEFWWEILFLFLVLEKIHFWVLLKEPVFGFAEKRYFWVLADLNVFFIICGNTCFRILTKKYIFFFAFCWFLRKKLVFGFWRKNTVFSFCRNTWFLFWQKISIFWL